MLNVKIDTYIRAGDGWAHEAPSRIVNHDDFEDRKWMGRHCFWAFRTGRKIVTTPIGENQA